MILPIYYLSFLAGWTLNRNHWRVWYFGAYGKIATPSFGKKQIHHPLILCKEPKTLLRNGVVSKEQGSQIWILKLWLC